MAERSIALRLRAEVGQFKQAMGDAAKSAQGLSERVGALGKKASDGFDRMKQSATDNSQAWTTAGSALTAFGAATTAVGLAAVKTGIEYNTLQQTSRAALKTLTGSTEAANAQMDKLDEFARNSPFAKQIFITAQQQMLGFGVAADKVLPTLGAIQDTVAAFGGSNDQIAAIADILSRMNSQGRLSGDALQRLGYYGVDAAKIIGEQMGLTSAEIKDMASKPGGIPVDQIWDPLVTGMNEKFGGAAADVKQTFEGAVDRVKAAWRDLGSEMAEPLVGAEGGGFLIDLANNAADTMRSFEKLPQPVKIATGAIAGVASVGSLAAGAFLLGLPRFLETKRAFSELAEISPRTAAGIKGIGKAAGVAGLVLVLAGAVGKLIDSLTTGVIEVGMNELEQKIRGVVDAGGDLNEVSAQFDNFGTVLGLSRVKADGLGEAFDKMLDPSKTDAISHAVGSFLGGVGYMNKLEDRVKSLDASLASMAAAGDTEAVESFVAALETEGYTIEQINQLLPQTKDALIGVEAATTETAEATADLAAEAEAAQKRYEAFIDLFAGASAAFIDIGGAYDAVVEKNKAFAQSTADATKSSKDSWEDYYDGVSVSVKDYLAELESQVAAQMAWQENMIDLAGRVSAGTLEELAKLGPEGAPLIAELVKASEKELGRLDAATIAKNKTHEFAEGILRGQGNLPMLEIHASTRPAELTVNDFIRKDRTLYVNVQGREVFDFAASGRRAAAAAGGAASLMMRADGGSVFGHDTETSDSIPALLSNNEHVWTAKEVRGAGGHSNVEALRAAARNGLLAQFGALPAFAAGGRVGWAQSQEKRAAKRVTSAKAEVSSAKRSVSAAKKTKNPADDKAAQQRLKRAEKALDAARSERRDWQAQVQRLKEDVRDLRVDARRGNIRDAATSGLSGAYGVVDQLFDQSRNTDLSKNQRGKLGKAADAAEKNMRKLYGQAEKVEGKLAAARDRVQELASIKASVGSALAGGFRLGDSIAKAEAGGQVRRSNAAGDVWYDRGGAASKGMVKDAKGYASRLKAFAGKLDRLRKLGMSGVVLQEIAGLGVDEGTIVADAMLAGGRSDVTALNKAYADIEKWSNKSGDYVTEGFFKGGVSAAEGIVKGLESQQAKIEAQILKIAKSMEKSLKKALGIKSPSLVMRGLMNHVGDGVTVGLDEQDSKVSAASERLGAAIVPSLDVPAFAVAASAQYAQPARSVNNTLTLPPGALAQAMDGVALTLMVDGKPMRGIIRSEIGSHQAASSAAMRAGKRS